MKFFYTLLIFLLLSNCSNQKKVFWCGDHACKNNKEKEAYFKKNMTVEIKFITKSDSKKKTSLTDDILARDNKYKKNKLKSNKKKSKEVIYKQKNALDEEKKFIEKAKVDEQKRIEEEELVKQILIEEKKLKEQEELTKQIVVDEEKDVKPIINEKKIISQDSDQNLLKKSNSNDNNSNDEFDIIVKKMNDKNLTKPFPNINDIPK